MKAKKKKPKGLTYEEFIKTQMSEEENRIYMSNQEFIEKYAETVFGIKNVEMIENKDGKRILYQRTNKGKLQVPRFKKIEIVPK